MKVIFLGTPEFAAPFLQELINDPEIEVAAAVCQPDKPVGRKGELTPGAVKVLAQKNGIEVHQPASLKTNEALVELSAIDADFFVVVAYGKIIPKQILDLPKYGCVNVHPSMLPKYRGPSPIQWAIAQGDAETGISIMLLDEGMDTGPILAFEGISIDGEETYETLVDKIHARGPKLLSETLKRLIKGEISPVPQSTQGASISKLLSREDGRIDWTKTMGEIDRRWRAYQPWPGAWSVWNKNGQVARLKILKMAPTDFEADLPPGTVAIKNNRLYVDCSDGTLELLEIQPEGKGRMSIPEFLNGYSEINGAVLA
ncbi:methionyl-tRNA formyltransferase [Patescibacteria group bacterium]|nr:methionyl-tRNA formyltransferase [Patescibacteria group bacterium]MBU1705404.1 methionyl-tRNA formyltransferase [Patescibacteria group bacterium]